MFLFAFIASALVALTAGAFARVSILGGLGLIVVGAATVTLPGRIWGDACFRWAEYGFWPFLLGTGLFLGAVTRLLLDAIPISMRLARIIFLMVSTACGVTAFLVGWLWLMSVVNQQKVRFERADILAVVQKMKEEKILSPDRELWVGRRCGLSVNYLVSYLDQKGIKAMYVVRSVPEGWEFISMDELNEGSIIRPKLSHPY